MFGFILPNPALTLSTARLLLTLMDVSFVCIMNFHTFRKTAEFHLTRTVIVHRTPESPSPCSYPLESVLIFVIFKEKCWHVSYSLTSTFRQTNLKTWTWWNSSNWSILWPLSGESMWRATGAGIHHLLPRTN